jgi:cytoskeleton protein RodZ
LNFPLPLSDRRVPTRSILIICILLAALTYGGWYYFSERQGKLADLVPAVPERLSHLLNPEQTKREITAAAQPAPEATPPQPVAGPPAAPSEQTPPAATSSVVPAPPAAASSAAPPQAGAATPVPPGAANPGTQAPAVAATPPTSEADGVPPVEDRPNAPAAPQSVPPPPDLAQPALSDAGKSPPQSAYGAPEGEARVVLHANADSWIQVRDSQGSLLITRVLKPGESYNVPNQQGLTMVTGNAGGLDISVDGTVIPRIGDTGRVARNVSLDPDRLLAGRPHAN